MTDAVERLAGALKKRAAGEIKSIVRENLKGLVQNPDDESPFEDEDEDEDDSEEDDDSDDDESPFEDDEDDEDDDSEETVGSLAFEDSDGEVNLQHAAAAYRVLGGEGDLVAQHPATGRAFFGTEEDLDEYAEGLDLSNDEWDVYDTADKVLSLKYDEAGMREVLNMLREQELDSAKKQFEEFHWGDESGTTVLKSIPGIEGALTFLGVGRRIEYFSKKDDEPVEYYHEFGEESRTYPSVYALGDDTIVIHGGQMRITPRGIVD